MTRHKPADSVICDLMHFQKLYYLTIQRFGETPDLVSVYQV